jgi:ferredoxin
MERLTLQKAKLASFLEALRDDYRVVAPQRIGPSDIVFDEFVSDGAIPFDYVNAHLPPKSLFFPARECLFGIEGSKHPKLQAPPAEKPLAIFGVRSCDATALLFLSRFFSERGFEDELVMNRIRNSLQMTLSCHTPGPECFCVCCDGGPFLNTGFDIQFTDLGEILLGEVATEKGAAAVKKASTLFSSAGAEDMAAKARQVEKVDQMFQLRSFMGDGIKRISLDRIPHESWERWAGDCQGCGGCCYLCPTCSCFTVRDAWRARDAYSRERTWDACLYEGFTREASGHNPRRAKSERFKRRFFHKMSYQYVEIMGRHGCVGCGRCVAACMGGLDISSLLSRIHDECK